MLIRTAEHIDILQILAVRNAVTENKLSNPNSITPSDVAELIFERGKGWVCEIDQQIVGFSIVDLQNHNVWALFLRPEFEQQGIGKKLHDTMLNWYFGQTKRTIWLGTLPQTRASMFYKKAGWKEVGMHGLDEIKFEMTYSNWIKVQAMRHA